MPEEMERCETVSVSHKNRGWSRYNQSAGSVQVVSTAAHFSPTGP